MGVEGISTGGVNINIRYADDAVVTADAAEKLRAFLDTVKRESERMGLKIHIKKTKVAVASKKPQPPNCNIMIDNTRIKQAKQLCIFREHYITRCKIKTKK